MGKTIKNLLLVSVAQIPLLTVARDWWLGLFQKSPILAAVLPVLYEVIVFGLVFGKKVWEQLEPDLVKATAGWIKITALNFFSGFRRRYNRHIIYEHRVFNVQGLRTTGTYTLEVEQVFVELQIAPSNPQQASANPVASKELSGSRPVWEFLRRSKKKEAAALAILGPPGCGKTTLLKHIALTFAANRQRRYRSRAYTPLLLFLREHVKTITEESLPLAELAQTHFSEPKRYATLKPPPHWFSRQMKAGKCLVLLDGLDEVVEAGQRQKIATWVDRQIRDYPRCHFLLTARPQGYRDAPLARAHVLEVMPFKTGQVEKFIRNWYLAIKITSFGGKDDPGVRQDAEDKAQDLFRRLRERPQLQELTVNPLLLTMIANVHNYRGVLPERRVELYAEICDVLLGHWRKAIGVRDSLSAVQKRVVLQPLAEELMKQKTREIAAPAALAVMRPHLTQVGVAANDIAAFLDDVQASSGLLLEKKTGVWSFAHLTFQEYLCAAHWDKTDQATGWDSARWQSLIGDSWWHEALRLYAAQSDDATPLVDACLQINTDAALSLAKNIAAEALKLDSAARAALTTSLERPVIHLRSEPQTVLKEEPREVFKLDENGRPLEYIRNDFEDLGDTVLDRATGLTWQKSGSDKRLTYEQAQEYIEKLNRERFAGHDDWRLPTIPELISLLEPEKQSHDLYINPIFDKYQLWCWSIDNRSAESAWVVSFSIGVVHRLNLDDDGYVRAVRS